MKRTTVAVLAVVLAANVAAGQNVPTDVVEKKALAAHGGEAVLKKYPAGTSKITGTVAVEGRDFPFSGALAFAVPGKVRLEMTIEVGGQKAALLQVVNGDKVKQTENGVVSKLDPALQAELRESAAIQELSLLYPLLDSNRYTLIAEKDQPVNGKDAHAFVVKAKNVKDTRLFFDKGTGLLVGMQRKGLNPAQKAVDEMTTFADFKAIDGLLVPLTSKVTHDGKPFLTIKVTDYKPLEKLDDKLFVVE